LLSSGLWWSGPKFLQLPEEKWPELNIPPTSSVVESELIKTPSLNTYTLIANQSNRPKTLKVFLECSRFRFFLQASKSYSICTEI